MFVKIFIPLREPREEFSLDNIIVKASHSTAALLTTSG